MGEQITESNNKRIAKNTLFLYIRTLLVLGVSLFTVRIVLEVLGVADYGIYNVIGGVVVMLSFLSNSMSSASQRFFAYELGKKNIDGVEKIFKSLILIYLCTALVFLIAGETVGLWFVNNKMNIPADRMNAANWVYQFSLLAFIVSIFRIPYNALIIASEKMKIFAYTSILEVVLKLLAVYILILFSFDKLKLYAILIFIVTLIVTLVIKFYCTKEFKESKFSFLWEPKLLKELLSFSGWSLFGNLSLVLKDQGTNILLNIFFGPIVNAARGIAYQISVSISQFVTNFTLAANPQIIKYYANNEKNKLFELIFRSSRMAFFLLFIISMPLLLETHFILFIWLKEVPEFVVLFTQLVLVNSLIDAHVAPLVTSALATGKIKYYQVTVGGLQLLNLPLSYLFLHLGFPPEVPFIISIILSLLNVFIRLLFLKKMINLHLLYFIRDVLVRIIIVSFIAYILPILVQSQFNEGWTRFIIVSSVGVLSSLSFIYLLGLPKKDRVIVDALVRKYYSKIKK